MSEVHKTPDNHANIGSYTIGFILSLIFTIIPYMLVVNDYVKGWGLVYLLFGFAIAQLLIQLVFFLHFGKEQKPRWNLITMLLMLLILLIVVVGSIWIMRNLHYNSQNTVQDEEYLLKDEGIAR